MPDFSLTELEGELTRRESYEGPYYSGKAQFKGMNPTFMDNFAQMSEDYFKRTGKQLQVDDAWRSEESQAEGHRQKPDLVAPSGHSNHPRGLAMDLNEAQANELGQMGLFEKYGFTRPMMGGGQSGKKEPWHIELANFEQAGKVAARVRGNGGFTLGELESELARREGTAAHANKNFSLNDLESELANREGKPAATHQVGPETKIGVGPMPQPAKPEFTQEDLERQIMAGAPEAALAKGPLPKPALLSEVGGGRPSVMSGVPPERQKIAPSSVGMMGGTTPEQADQIMRQLGITPPGTRPHAPVERQESMRAEKVEAPFRVPEPERVESIWRDSSKSIGERLFESRFP